MHPLIHDRAVQSTIFISPTCWAVTIFDERRSIDRALVIEGKAKVFRERAFARSIEAGNPHAHFIFAACFHCELHAIEKSSELLLDAFSHNVFGNLRLQAVFLSSAISDDLLDGPVDVFLGSSFKCNTSGPLGIGCCDGQTKQAPQ